MPIPGPSSTLDVLTLAEGRLAVKLGTSTVHDDLLPQYITAVSLRLDQLIGPIVTRAVTENLDGGGYYVNLELYPVLTFTSVTEYDGTASQVLTAETNASKTSNNYLADLATGLIYRRAEGNHAAFPYGRANVVVVYNAGRAATTAAVDGRIKLAASIMLGHMWRMEQASGSDLTGEDGEPSHFTVPSSVRELLADQIPMIAG